MGKKLFSQVENVKDVLDILCQNLDKVITLSLEILEYNYHSLTNLSLEHESHFLALVHYIDDCFSAYEYYDFTRYKIPTILSAATYYHDFYENIKDYTLGELSTLAKFSAIDPVEVYSSNLQLFSKNILSVIERKTTDFMTRDKLMNWVYLSDDNGVDCHTICSELQNKSLPALVKQSFSLVQKKVEESGFSDGRRF